MPVSALQHRFTAGAYQNKLHDNIRGSSTTQAQGINPVRSAIPDEIHHLGSSINRAVNSHEELSRPSYQTTSPRQGIAAPLLMLLSQVRLDGIPVSSTTDIPAFTSERSVSPSVSRNTAYSDNSNTGFSAMLSPVANALYETGSFITRNDPLRFPVADAAPLCSGSHLPDDFVTFLNSNGINVVARGLEQLKCIEHDKYEFFKGVSFNAMNLLDSAIKQLEDKRNNELDNHLRYYGIVDVDDVKPRLASIYKK
ncbi:hypothetical protein [Serratia fonticola]|nr:hypothetical protein [Serratia fonticola]